VWEKLLLVAAGGALGSSARYLTSLASGKVFGAEFPVGTLIVNLVGCLLIGIGFALAEERSVLSPHGRLFFMTGVLGGLTTFSTYALESVTYFGDGARVVALANIVVNNVLGLLLVLAGMAIGRTL
jgi:fluoride exporter